MRILFVNRHGYGCQVPTARMLVDVALCLAERGHCVSILASNGGYVDDDQAKPSHERIRFIEVPMGPIGRVRAFAWVWFWFASILTLPFLPADKIVLLTDPPFLSWCAVVCGRQGRFRRKIWLWTMDLYPDSLVAHGLLSGDSFVRRLLDWLNGRCARFLTGIIALDEAQAFRIKDGFRSARDRLPSISVVPPWDDRQLSVVPRGANRFLAKYKLVDKKVVLYAGNLGTAHLWEPLVSVARVLRDRGHGDIAIVFVVRGVRKTALVEAVEHLDNVLVCDYQPESWTSDLLYAADIHVVTMRKGWEGIVVPSKTYGAIRTGRPILYLGPLGSGIARIVQEKNVGVALDAEAEPVEIVESVMRLFDHKISCLETSDLGPVSVQELIEAT